MSWKKLLLYFLIWQFAIIFITWIAPIFLTLRGTYLGGASQAYFSNISAYSRANFDGNHYLTIAERGYGFAQQAFFPIYPILIQLISRLHISLVYSGLIISNISFFIALVIFRRLIQLDYSAQIADWTIILMLFFPVSFFFSFVYTEGLFFLLIAASFYLARTHRWWGAGLVGALASGTRVIGIALFPALIIEFILQKKPPRQALPLLLIPLGLVAYMSYLQLTTQDPLLFMHVQGVFHQGRSIGFIPIFQVFWRYLKMLVTVNRADPLYLAILLEFFSGAVFTLTSVISLFKQRFSYAFFNFVCVLLPTTTGSFTSISRYALVAFPSFILLSQYFLRLPRVPQRIILIALSGLFSLYLMLFVRGFWVA